MIKLYVIDTIENNRGELFPLLKPFLKNEGFTDEDRIKLYGVSEKDFCIVKTIEEADYYVLPMSWNFYALNNKTATITKIINEAKFQNKNILSFTSGDFGFKTPSLKNLFIFRWDGDKTKLSTNNFGLPVFITDPVFEHYKTNKIEYRPFNTKPTIGFCGQANGSNLIAIKEIIRTFFRNSQFHLGLTNALPQALISTTKLRYNLLQRCLKSSSVISNFIFRKKYRAGATNKEDRKKTTQEFYDNLKTSDYILCVRGGGNFSVRLYETLAMGRIPVFVNTDCILPLEINVYWRKHVVWIENNEKDKIVEKIVSFHKAQTPESFMKLQQNNRLLWEEQLTLGGFFTEALDNI